MNDKSTGYSSSNKICQWCIRQTNQLQLRKNCQHKFCKKCTITGTNCQSDCPLCWYTNTAQYIRFNNICSGKIK
jgi:hypothetical protein